MKLSAIHLGKVSWLVETTDLDPEGKLLLGQLAPALGAAGHFGVVPDFFDKERQKNPGLTFEHGVWGDQRINKFTMFNDGLVLETSSDTANADAALLGIALWAKENFGVNFEPEMIKRKGYQSQVVVFLDYPIDSLNPILGSMAGVISESVSKIMNQRLDFRASEVQITTSTLATKYSPGIFSIARRIDVPDSENRYFSTAPLQTAEHLALLQEFEHSLKPK